MFNDKSMTKEELKIVKKALDIVYDKQIEPLFNNDVEIIKEDLYDMAFEYNNGMRDDIINIIKQNWEK